MGWFLPVATLVSGVLGYKASKDANKTQQNAINAQQSAEAAKQAQINEQLSLADRMLYGGGNVGQTMTGAVPQAETWTQDYLNWLRTAPDITYNAQRGQMESNIRSSMEQAARISGMRGLTGGVAAAPMAGLGMQRAGLLASLEGQRQDRRGANLAAGTQLTQGLVDRALNVRSGALGTALNQQTQIPQMMQGVAAGQANQAAAYGNLTGTLLNTMFSQQQQPRVQAPTAPALPGYTPLPDYQFNLGGAGYSGRYA